MFGLSKCEKQEKSNRFIENLKYKNDDYLLTAYSALDMDSMCGSSNGFIDIERRAIEDELEKRGYVDSYNYKGVGKCY